MIWIAPEKLFKKEAEMGSFQNGIKPQKNKKKKKTKVEMEGERKVY